MNQYTGIIIKAVINAAHVVTDHWIHQAKTLAHILREWKKAHIDGHEYFSQMVHDDIDTIIRDIREAHRHDSVSTPEMPAAEQMKKDLEEVANFKGSRLEKTVMLYCKQLQIDYRKLTEEEFRALIQILRKSKMYSGSGRGKR